jgi:hypothetical protein
MLFRRDTHFPTHFFHPCFSFSPLYMLSLSRLHARRIVGSLFACVGRMFHVIRYPVTKHLSCACTHAPLDLSFHHACAAMTRSARRLYNLFRREYRRDICPHLSECSLRTLKHMCCYIKFNAITRLRLPTIYMSRTPYQIASPCTFLSAVTLAP